MKNKEVNLEVLKLAARELKNFKEELVLLGGATISLFITEPEVVQIRETYDVDCVVEVSHRQDYEDFVKKLRKAGFNEDFESKVLCRFKKDSLILDVMPTNPKVLGFTNIWYKDGFKNSKKIKIDNEEFYVFDLPYLIATKIEAFKGRGKGEYLYSHDVEDIITLFDGRTSITADLLQADSKIKSYLKNELGSMVKNKKFIDSLDGHISDRINLIGRKAIVLSRIEAFLK